MDQTINRFVKKDNPIAPAIFEQMSINIGKRLNIDSSLVKTCGINALNAWELYEGNEISSIYQLEPLKRDIEMRKVLLHFQRHLKATFQDNTKVQKSLDMAEPAFRYIFKL